MEQVLRQRKKIYIYMNSSHNTHYKIMKYHRHELNKSSTLKREQIWNRKFIQMHEIDEYLIIL